MKRKLTGIIAVMALAPGAVALGLFVFRSVAVTFALFHGCVCLMLPMLHMVFRREKPGTFFRSLGLVSTPGGVLPALLWGMASFAAVFAFFSVLRGHIWDAPEVSHTLSMWGIQRIHPILFVSMMVVGNGFLEEFFWRGYALRRLMEQVSPRSALVLSSLFCASYHVMTTGALFSLSYAVVSVASIFFAGLVWGGIRMKTGSLLLPVVTHVFIDLAIMAVYLLYLR